MTDTATPRIELWFDPASTYSYLSAMRFEAMATAAGMRPVWRPFLLGPIFHTLLGFADSPFNRNPVRGRYMWRDVERRCAMRGLPFRRPSRFPCSSLLAARIALLGENESWIGDFVRAVFSASLAHDRDIGSSEVIGDILDQLSLDTDLWLQRSRDAGTKELLRARTEDAAARGVFGAPAFIVDGELFWGDDRLEDALMWPSCARVSAMQAGTP